MDLNDKKLKLKELIDQFHKNVRQYKSSIYDEANTRVDFIDKFFELLDWDIRNNQGFSEQYREVIREDRVQIEGKQKAPDYSFRIGGIRKFFVEAKKPGVDLKESIEPAFQVRRYGYSAKIPMSILTDFEEFSVYDTRIKPDKTDKASTARIFYSTFEDYEKHFDFIYDTFSKNAILKGSFDRYIEENKNKKGTSEIDRELLKLIEEWRTELAKNIALRNNEIDIYNLNNAVQKIIDRIIFLRIAEDREIEPYENLLKISRNSNVYENLDRLFQNANNKYNAGLFKPEEWLSKLTIDDKVLSGIIREIYYPCPYEFSILPIEILGNIYEQFLGKTIRFKNVKEGHTAVIEEKPEVRKAGGVYYTPQYIVNYIVENTVGEKIKSPQPPLLKGEKRGMTPEEIASLKICDPACGSGSFLVGAFSFLLNYHLDHYSKEKNIKKALKEEKIYQIPPTPFDKGGSGGFKLTIEEKQKILINNIYGVDIDRQAVEVTKLSLYLKLLENESIESKDYLFSHSDIKLLPTLDNNIKCGNSLIGSDFYKEKEMSLFGNDEMRKVNVFDWEKEFPEIFKNGGFDVVIGNPPYGAELSEDEKEYLIKKYKSYEYQLNSFSFFIELSIKLLKMNSFISLITPSVFINQHYFMNLRKEVLNNFIIKKIIILNYKVFQNADTGDTCIFVFEKQNDEKFIKENIFKSNKISNKDYLYNVLSEQNQIDFFHNPRYEITLSNGKIFNKINGLSICLKNISICIMGIKPYQVGKGKPKQNQKNVDERNFDSKNRIDDNYKKYLIGKDIDRYIIKPIEDRFIKYGEWLAEPRFSAPFEKKKIIIRQTSDVIRAVIDDNNYYNLNNIYNLEITDNKYDYRYILGILNSKLMIYIYQIIVPEKGRLFAEIKKVNLDKLPIRKIDFSNPSEKQAHDRLVSLVDQMLETQKQFHNAKSDSDKMMFRQKIDIIDRQIDDQVYKLYGLTEEEIRIVVGEE